MNRFAKLLLVCTSLAPILLTWAFADWRTQGYHIVQASLVATAVLLVALAYLLIRLASAQIDAISFSAGSLKTADTEVLGFIVAYLLPLVSIRVGDFDLVLLGFVGLLLGLVVWNTNTYSVNPLLSLLGYHFYEISNEDGVSFLFVSRRDLRRVADITKVRPLTRYVLLDGES